VGRLPWPGDRTNDYHREGIFLGLEGMRVRLLLGTARAYTLPGCCILTLGGLGFGLSTSIAGARIASRSSKGEVACQYRPPRLHSRRLALEISVRFIIEEGLKLTDNIVCFMYTKKETRCGCSS